MKSFPWVGLCAPVLVAALLAGCAGSGPDGPGGQRGEVVSAALSQMGTPYRYGGNEPGRGLDCSGLTYYAHRAAGVEIPRSSRDQRRGARPVRGKRLRAGDMVFFATGPGSHHVGLMVDSDRFVHASSTKGQVMVTRLSAPYWQTHYLGAGTYLK